MKICIASAGVNEDSQVSPVFGRCPYFAVFDEKTKEFTIVKNESREAHRGAGVAAAQKVSDLGCKAAIAGNFGPNAVNVLNASGIKIFRGFGITVKEAFEQYQAGKLKEITAATTASFGRGFGGGRGRGGRW